MVHWQIYLILHLPEPKREQRLHCKAGLLQGTWQAEHALLMAKWHLEASEQWN